MGACIYKPNLSDVEESIDQAGSRRNLIGQAN